ncbi:MAG: hypothetical protein ACK52I_08945 [Pseudomonadota bacterium]|jgi:hypothetical protein|uniref:hypothetical protein n=1 Tax=Pseudanabaena mucicola TaxID=71190 RepID=UPI002574F24C|nr:hypothetical protein [Pseudanabaena mucicola]
MQISKLLRDTADRFNRSANIVCKEWEQEVAASGVCCPVNFKEFDRLIKAKILLQMEVAHIALHQQKISA